MNRAGAPAVPERSIPLRIMVALGHAVIWIALTVWLLWAAGALWFDLPAAWPRGIVIVYLVAGAAIGVFLRRRKRMLSVAALCLAVNAWWLTISPSNDRDWQPNVAVTAYAEVDGDVVTIHNVRNTEYRTESDYTPNWKTRRVRLSQLLRVDMFLCYWGSPWLAHPFVSFVFADADPICFSIETRMEKGEEYSTLGGLYRRYELYYLVGEEPDLVRLRTMHRVGEDAYLFRIDVGPDRARSLFLDYVATVNEMHDDPRFYNVLVSNCTTNIRAHSVATAESPRPWDWRILLPGKLDELLYRRNAFVSKLPLDELKPRCLVDPVANRVGSAADFSRRIREGVPGFEERE